MEESVEGRILAFQVRMQTELEFCHELFVHSTTRLMAAKYCYYIKSDEMIKDYAYDLCEKDWFVMGRALGLLKEDETSPCVDFNYDHPLAQAGIALANRLMKYEE